MLSINQLRALPYTKCVFQPHFVLGYSKEYKFVSEAVGALEGTGEPVLWRFMERNEQGEDLSFLIALTPQQADLYRKYQAAFERQYGWTRTIKNPLSKQATDGGCMEDLLGLLWRSGCIVFERDQYLGRVATPSFDKFLTESESPEVPG